MITDTQCGNVIIFLSIWFYVKSIFRNFWSAKFAILTYFEALNVDCYEFLHFLKAEIYQINQNSKLWNGKKGSFGTPIFSKSDFKHEYLRSRASIRLLLSSPCHLLAIYGLSRYSCLYLGSLHPRISHKIWVIEKSWTFHNVW